ncbi:MAG: proline hydroxylase [Alteromonadaceae bacterium]|nr:proline hydroxylase [Alteromonadaceae bacterium]
MAAQAEFYIVLVELLAKNEKLSFSVRRLNDKIQAHTDKLKKTGSNLQITFHPEINFEAISAEYQHDKRVRVQSLIPMDQAEQVYNSLSKEAPYKLALLRDGRPTTLADNEWKQLPDNQKQRIHTETMQNAAKGVGFIYGRYQLSNQKEPIANLAALHQWLNSEAVLSWVREISGHHDIVAASAQATRYTAGQFLTRHMDTHSTEQRRLAYVLSFSPNWHPDWGGLLQFYEKNGTPRDAWAPGFNTLSIFDVEHIHSVTYITPFSLTPRLSVTGWFRATPL